MPELIDLQIPSLGESVSEATIAKWVKNDGDYVKMDEVVAELETDKATVEMNAPKAGTLKIAAKKGDTIYSIAKNFDLTVAELRDLNQLSRKHKIRAGEKLRVSTTRALTAGGM